jgi:methionyl-tRNA formyltransferase
MSKFLFVGNRKFVLEEMLRLELDVKVLVITGTHLHREKFLDTLPHVVVEKTSDLINEIQSTDFDILISNGCPHILPISQLKKAIYANIHPSFLPDLKGIDPAHGAILFKRDAGATCHVMSDQIDSGDLISQVKIPYSQDLDASLLYQLSFVAEKQTFNQALERGFAPQGPQEAIENPIYYSRRPEDKQILFRESNEHLIQKIKAFNNKSQGCKFSYNGAEFLVYDVETVSNSYAIEIAKGFGNLEILFCYEDSILFKKDDELIKLKKVVGPLKLLTAGSAIAES